MAGLRMTMRPAWLERAVPRERFWYAALLVACLATAYGPSLTGGYIGYDDDWLIATNPVLALPPRAALEAIFFDWTRDTRLALGAEYLPVRDLSHWLEMRLAGGSPRVARRVQLGLYVLSALLLWGALQRNVAASIALRARGGRVPLGEEHAGRRWAALAAAFFALHPVHVESVAWLAGRKDVLALLFVCAASWLYERPARQRGWLLPCLALAFFSKAMSVVAPGLLLAQDCLARRRPRWLLLSAAGALSLSAAAAHWVVGARVEMVGGPLSESRLGALLTMGEVWCRYAAVLIDPRRLSLVHEVTPRTAPTALGLLGFAGVLFPLGYCLWRGRRGDTRPLGWWLWVVLPLVPVSQVLVPLQNVMADRYLWLSVLPLAALGASWQARGGRRRWLSLGFLAVWSAATATRANRFADAAAVFADAESKTRGPRAPYQLAMALERRGEGAAARAAFRRAIARPCVDCEPARRSHNNLARSLARAGQLPEARTVLESGIARFPDDPKLHRNLIRVLTRLGEHARAREAFDRAASRLGVEGLLGPNEEAFDSSRSTASPPATLQREEQEGGRHDRAADHHAADEERGRRPPRPR